MAIRRRPSSRRTATTNDAGSSKPHHHAHLPSSLDALDLSTSSAKQALASIRFLVLSHLADLEARLSQLESPLSSEQLRIQEWVQTALEMLESIRDDITSRLPDFHSGEELSHLSMWPEMPEMVMPKLSDLTQCIDDVRTRFSELEFDIQSYMPMLSDRLRSLHNHLSSLELPSHSSFAHLFDVVMSSDLMSELKDDIHEAEDMLERAKNEVSAAIKRSLEGSRLIEYYHLPEQWKNNRFVTTGYRFIPLRRWPLIIISMFAFHNETLNIHTHFIPFILWSLSLMPFIKSAPIHTADAPEIAFIAFALICLASSVVWHTMAGCADERGMDICARIDYVGIGWLISASVGTIVHYGFKCYPSIERFFLTCCFFMGLAGNIFPFMDWFNQLRYRMWRIAFFLAMGFTAIAPLSVLIYLHGSSRSLAFVGPVFPSVASYVIGLVFYATHIPERWMSRNNSKLSRFLDYLGGGSHAIWHVFIVIAIAQHKTAIGHMKAGLGCPVGGSSLWDKAVSGFSGLEQLII